MISQSDAEYNAVESGLRHVREALYTPTADDAEKRAKLERIAEAASHALAEADRIRKSTPARPTHGPIIVEGWGEIRRLGDGWRAVSGTGEADSGPYVSIQTAYDALEGMERV